MHLVQISFSRKMKILCRRIPTSELWKRFWSRLWFIYDKSRKWSHFLIMMTSNDLYQFWEDFRFNPFSLRFESGIEDFEQSNFFMAKNPESGFLTSSIFDSVSIWIILTSGLFPAKICVIHFKIVSREMHKILLLRIFWQFSSWWRVTVKSRSSGWRLNWSWKKFLTKETLCFEFI